MQKALEWENLEVMVSKPESAASTWKSLRSFETRCVKDSYLQMRKGAQFRNLRSFSNKK